MVGGVVVDIHEKTDCLTLTVVDCPQSKPEFLCVNIEKGWNVEFGDQVWWQCGKVYWTPAGSHRQDVPIPKIGYSYPPVRQLETTYVSD